MKRNQSTAQPAAYGLVGCTEAVTVLDEYLAIPAAERDASLDGTDLASGWTCVTATPAEAAERISVWPARSSYRTTATPAPTHGFRDIWIERRWYRQRT